MREAQSRQKSYSDNRRRKLEFDVDDEVFVRVSPMKGVMRFSRSGKLAPRYIGPFSIIERIGPVAYRVSMPAQFLNIQDVFHVSQLRKSLRKDETRLETDLIEEIEISPDLTFVQQPIRIVATQVKHLRNKDVPLVKVQWSANPKDCSWETREHIERHHPDLLSL